MWRCVKRLEEKGSDCVSPTIAEPDLHDVVTQAINQTLTDRGKFNATLRQNIEAIVGKLPETTEDIDTRLKELQLELIRLANSHDAYEAVAEEIMRLREQKEEAMTRTADQETKHQRMIEMAEFLQEQGNPLIEYDDTLTRRLVERVTVGENRLTVTFKSGIEVEI